ncbi:MAG: discoidin domain-containing protein, partial [Verrucomicrobiota bacterium]
SALSNVASATTADEVAPSVTSDLVASAASAAGTLSVSLTAPGDDGTFGRATAYDLRYALTALDAASFLAAAPLAAPAPGTAGVPQVFTVSGLPNETEIFLMLRTRDDAGNWSALSNLARATTAAVAPSAITDLASAGQGIGSVTLRWTATGDDGKVGTAAATDLRYALFPITDANFAAGTAVATNPPGGAGLSQTATATGLSANKTYYFAIKVEDDRGNWSALSNVVSVATEDTLAPGAIAIAAATGSAAGSIALSWTATGDDGAQGTAKRYELRRSSSVITAATWAAATVVTSTAPKAAGAAESLTVTGLKGETTHHFAIRAADEVDNMGPLSNDAAANTAPVAPAAVVLAATLAITNSKASATLSWAAPGDDGAEGTATAYDIRFSTSPITAASFGTAAVLSAPVTVPTPAAAGMVQTVVVPDLQESTTYYFALKAVDDTQTWSALSNVPSVNVPDLTKPGAPSGLTVGTPDTGGKRLVATKVTPSSVLGPSWDAANAVDGDATSAWASAGSDDSVAQSLVLDFGSTQSIEQVKLSADAKYLELFPRDFTLAVSGDGNSWKTVVTETAFSVTSAEAISWGFPAETGRYLRLAVTDTGVSFDKHYVIVAELEVDSAAAADGQAQLTWLATGDDGLSGKATRYEVFRHTRAFATEELGSVTPVANPPVPAPAGQLQTMTVTALHGETTYFWAVRAVDEAGNVGALSAVVGGATNNVPPAAVRSLAGKASASAPNTSIDLTWTATGDDGLNGVATSYEIRYLAGPLSSQNFAAAKLVPGLPPPVAAKVAQAVSVTGLLAGVTYRFGLVAKDAAGNASFISNIAVVATNSPPDVTPPAAVTDLTVDVPAAGGKLLSGKVIAQSSEQAPTWKATAVADKSTDTFWASAVRAASQEEWVRVEYPVSATVDRVRVWPSAAYPALFPPDVAVRVSPDGLAWTTVATAANVTAAAGSPVTLSFPATSLRFVELRATRLAQQGAGVYTAAVAEIETLTASEPPGTLVVSWTSPADDGATGRAASYDLRVGACPFAAATATAVTTAAPRDAGTPERARATGKPAGTYCVAVRSTDAAGNASALSNVATITLP